MTPRRTGEIRAWLLTAALILLAAGASLALPAEPPLRAGVLLPWWSLAIAYFLAGIFPVHIGVRRHAHTITLGEVPLVLGLVAASPAALLSGVLAGTALALILYRRQRPVKVAFNLAVFVIEVVVAVLVMRAVLGGGGVDSPTGWLATLAGTLAASLVSAILVATAIAVSSGHVRLRELPPVVGVALAATAVNTVLGLGGLDVVEHDPRASLVLVIPLVALAVAYRNYVGERHKHARVQVLYETSRALHRSRGVDVSIATLLSRARRMFNAEVAELVLLPTSSTEVARRCSLSPDDGDDDGFTVTGVDSSDPAARIRSGAPAVLLDRADPAGILATRGLRDGIAVSISGEGGATGTLVVANRRDAVSAFGRDDLELLEAFAGPASVALDNGWLQAELEHLAFHDSLTGLPNRALLTQRLQAVLDRRPRRCALLLLDIDDFKMVNDTLGHPAGDRLLVDVGDRLVACIPPGDTAARLGGDEFAVMLGNVDGREAAAALAERVLEAMQPAFTVAGCELAIHASVGVVVPGPAVATVDDLLSSADLAMYRAKARGKNRCVVFEPIMQVEVLARHQLRSDLERAVQDGTLAVHYQPIVSLHTGAVVGAEALVRWTHDVRGPVAPDEFIPLAEETGLVIPLGLFVLERACADLARWSRTLPDLQLGVNVSARQLQSPGFVADVTTIIGRHGIAAARLTLEVTEHVMLDDRDALAALADLRALGMRIAVDDFGTGYSSLNCLGDLPIDSLKIAKPFVDRLARSDADRALVTTIVGLADSLGLSTVAEGVERPDQAAALREAGCGSGQGFLFSRAVPAADFLERATPPQTGATLTLAG